LGCRKRLAAQLATCSDALGTWLARAAIVGGAFMLRVPRGHCSEKQDMDPDSVGDESKSDPNTLLRNSRQKHSHSKRYADVTAEGDKPSLVEIALGYAQRGAGLAPAAAARGVRAMVNCFLSWHMAQADGGCVHMALAI
jgi:hypothetical protein